VSESSGQPAINILGVCQGGAFSLCFASIYPDKVRNLITMVTPVDFRTPDNMLSNWVQSMDVDLFVDTLGNVPADLMNLCYLMLKPVRLNQQKYVGLVDILDDKVEMVAGKGFLIFRDAEGRAAEVPARIVTGYQGGERNPIDGYWTVRQSDAHAWAEVWIEGRGWVRVDPTGAISPERIGAFNRLRAPRGALGSAMDSVISPGVVQQLRAVWEAANNRWNQWVLNYTQVRQLDLLKAMGFEAPDWQDLVNLLAALVAAAALGAAGWSAWERLQHDPWLRLLARVRKRLAQAGLPLPAHLPPRGMAQAVRAHGLLVSAPAQ